MKIHYIFESGHEQTYYTVILFFKKYVKSLKV